jgi:hypothetical protein
MQDAVSQPGNAILSSLTTSLGGMDIAMTGSSGNGFTGKKKSARSRMNHQRGIGNRQLAEEVQELRSLVSNMSLPTDHSMKKFAAPRFALRRSPRLPRLHPQHAGASTITQIAQLPDYVEFWQLAEALKVLLEANISIEELHRRLSIALDLHGDLKSNPPTFPVKNAIGFLFSQELNPQPEFQSRTPPKTPLEDMQL